MRGARAAGECAGRILVVGRNSFLARHFLAALSEAHKAVGHDEIGRHDLLDGVRTVLCFARHPDIGRDGYDLTHDPDVRLARRVGRREIAYLMLSSRKVYADPGEPLLETSPLGPSDAYGRNKLAVEEELRGRLGDRLTVLRLANVFGYERTPGRRTFLSITLEQLAANGRICYDMSPFVERDFLPAERAAAALAKIAERPPGGILNLGSGIPLPAGRIALWLLEGFGRGELVIRSGEERDPFVLDITRLRSLYGAPCTIEDLRASCLAIGRRLAQEVARAFPDDR
jgi:UDP-glucose 4-epimerase